MLEVLEEPAGHLWRLLARLMELPPHVRDAAGQHDDAAASADKTIISLVAVALEGAAKVRGNHILQAAGGTACLPVEDDIAARLAAGPKVTQLGLSISRREITQGRFIHLHIAFGKDSFLDLLIDRLEPFRA